MGIFPFDAQNVDYDCLVTGAKDFLTEAEVETEDDQSTPKKKRSSIELVLQMEKDGTVSIHKQKVTPMRTPRKATPKKATSNPEGATPGQLIDFDIVNDPDFHVDGMDELIETFDFPDLGVAPLPDKPPPLGTTPVLLPQVGATEDVTTSVGATEDVTMTVGVTEDVTMTVGATGTTKEGSTDASMTKEGSTDASVTKEGSTDAGVTKEGLTDAGATKEGSTDAGATKEGLTNRPRFQFVKAAQEMLQQEAAKEKEAKGKEVKEKEAKERERGPFQMPPWFPPPPCVAWHPYVPPPYFATMPPPMPPPGPWNMSPVQPMLPHPVSKDCNSEWQKVIERLEKRGAMPAIILWNRKSGNRQRK